MSDLKPRGVPVMLGGVERHFIFTLNAIDAAQDKIGKSMQEIMTQLTEEENVMPTLRSLIVILSEDEAERERYRNPESTLQPITEHEAGLLIGIDNLWELVAAIMRAYGISLPEPEEGEDPNGKSGQMKN